MCIELAYKYINATGMRERATMHSVNESKWPAYMLTF